MMKLDKKGWKIYRFDEFAQNISQRVEPQQTDLTVYVGLEHLDPDSLHIKRNGSPSDVEGTKLKFYKGDIIFGKRRAYQRKAALAECDGICSAHAMVLRAKIDLIDERLFPFFFHSKVFQKRAIEISVGGLSPTINWKDLAKQEFLLPPKEEQAKLAELLWAADEVVEKKNGIKSNLNLLQERLFINVSILNREPNKRLGDILEFIYGKPLKESERKPGIYPVIGSAGITGYHNEYKNNGPGIVVGRKGLAGNVIWIKDNFWPIDTAYWIKLKDFDTNLYYIYILLKSVSLEKLAITTAIPGLNREDALAEKIFFANKSEQDKIVRQFKKLDELLISCEKDLNNSQQLKSTLINQIF